MEKENRDEINANSIGISIDELVLRLLNDRKVYSRDKQLIDMQFAEKELSELQESISKKFSIKLHPTFFFQYPSPEAIIQHLIEIKLKAFRDWLYEIQWKSTPIPEIQTLPYDMSWIIFSEESNELLPHINKLLTEELQNVFILHPGDSFKKISSNVFNVNFNTPNEFEQYFGKFSGLNRLYGVIYLCEDPHFTQGQEPSFLFLEAYFKKLSGEVTGLINGIDRLNLAPKLWLITKSYILDGTLESIAQYPISALCRVIAEEYPQIECRTIALDPQVEAINDADILYSEISSNSNEPQAAWKNGKRFVARIMRKGVKEVRVPEFSPDASYLIVGGLRPLGLLFAWWYISHGAKHLILLDDINETTSSQAAIKGWKNQGANITTFIVDFDDEKNLKETFKKIKKEFPPLKGVLHAAGIIDNELIKDINWERIKPIIRLKIAGSWNIHLLTQEFDLDHFVLFSSCVFYLAPLGKMSHTLGNSFLEVLSHYRKNKGLPSLTINWGPWNPLNTIIKKMIDNTLTNRMDLLNIEDAFRALDNIFYTEKPQVIDVNVKWPALLSRSLKENPFFDEISKELGVKKNILIQNYYNIASKERLSLIQSFVHDHVRRLMLLNPDQSVDYEKDFSDLGIDHLEMAHLKNLMQFDIENIVLPANFVESHPSISKLSNALLKILNERKISKVKKTGIY